MSVIVRGLCHSNVQGKAVVKALINTSLDSTPSYTTTTCHSILRYNDKQLAGKKALSKDLIISSVLTVFFFSLVICAGTLVYFQLSSA